MHIKSAQEQIAEIRDGERISFHFAIMEVEAWLLGMHQYLKSIDERLESDYILEKIGINLQEDPETTVFHPARRLDDIYALVDKHYHKHESDIETIMAALKVEDFKGLIRSGKCNSFKTFTESLLGESGAFFD